LGFSLSGEILSYGERMRMEKWVMVSELIRLAYRLLGFLSGSVLAAAGMYFYVLQEYRVSNELLTEDIYVYFPPLLYLTCFGTNEDLS
jgi:hypothetical protein